MSMQAFYSLVQEGGVSSLENQEGTETDKHFLKRDSTYHYSRRLWIDPQQMTRIMTRLELKTNFETSDGQPCGYRLRSVVVDFRPIGVTHDCHCTMCCDGAKRYIGRQPRPELSSRKNVGDETYLKFNGAFDTCQETFSTHICGHKIKTKSNRNEGWRRRNFLHGRGHF